MNNDLINGFKSLIPVASENAAQRNISYALSHDSTGYHLSANTHGTPLHHLPTTDRYIISELSRVSSARGFDIGWGDSKSRGSISASLTEYPHLARLIPQCHGITDPSGSPLKIADYHTPVVLQLTDIKQNVHPTLLLRTAERDIPLFNIISDEFALHDHTLYQFDSLGENFAQIPHLLSPVPKDMIGQYVALFLTYVSNVLPERNGIPVRFSQHAEQAVPTILLEKVAADRALYLRIIQTLPSASNDMESELPLSFSAIVEEDGSVTVRPVTRRNISEDEGHLEQLILSSAPNRQAKKDVYREGNFFIIPAETAGPFLLNHLNDILTHFKLLGSEKLKEYKISAATPKLNVRLSSGIDFLEGDADVQIGEQKFTIADILRQFNSHRYVKLSDGNRAILDEKYVNRLQRLFNKRDRNGKIHVTLFDLPEIETLIKDKVSGEFAQKTREVFEGFNRLKSLPNPDYPVHATLRNYQKEGVKWIKYLYDNELGGCLADDMGLGKTLQTITVLSTIYPGEQKPTLIVMPRSLLFNWQNELDKFAPQVSVSQYYGTDRNLEESLKANVVLTTYAVARNDIERLKDIEFQYIILDESQNIKNVSSLTAQAIMLLNSKHRLALSGTPMENNLTELYSLFRFLNPTMFGSLEDFNTAYTYPIQKQGDDEAALSLRRRIFPFILRRLKKEVLDELPDRIEQTIYVEMSAAQRSLYEERRIAFRDKIR